MAPWHGTRVVGEMPLFTAASRFLSSLVVLSLGAFAPAAALAQKPSLASSQSAHERVLDSFQSGFDGAGSRAKLLADGTGGFYGTTEFGGGGCQSGCGTVFHLTRGSNGQYVERVVHRFLGAKDGTNPQAGLVADATGALYGTTLSGGNGCSIPGCGSVYKLTPLHGGGFSETVIYRFAGGNTGANPSADLLVDRSGNLIGTANGGAYGAGIVFELTPKNGAYVETVLYAFGAQPGDGAYPSGAPIVDADGNVYGCTSAGGAAASGTAYRLSPGPQGYTETVVYSFSGGTDGASPNALAFGPRGVLYGTAYSGGFQNRGVVFSLAPITKNIYNETTLQVFTTLGASPAAGVYVDASGALYGTTEFGGLPGCVNGGGCGVVFRMTPAGTGFTYTVMHVFGGGRDGSQPSAALMPGTDGALYGTTFDGGTANEGTVYRIE